jgi:threonine/homoserine/homoserine lactone efflux protein
MPFLKGLLLGIGMLVFLGPVFFTLIRISVSKGRAAGISTALGIAVSDVVAILLCYWGASKFFESTSTLLTIAFILAGVFLLVLGVVYLIKIPEIGQSVQRIPVRGLISAFFNGFAVNFINPFVFMVWIAVVSLAQSSYPLGSNQVLFLSAAVLGILLGDLSKVFLATRIDAYLKPQWMRPIYRGIGLIMVAFALRMFYSAWVM